MPEAEISLGSRDAGHGRRGIESVVAPTIEAVLWLTLLALCAGAFAGLSATSYWIDELWTLWVADPAVSAAEVVRRSLMDAHPPAFYLVLHAWMRLLGDGETPARAFSALCAVGACLVFVATTGAAFSRPARVFAAVAGAGSLFWFDQSQNLRSYSLALLVMSVLLALALTAKAQARAGGRPARALVAAFGAAGLFGAFVHFYLFLTVGLTYLAVIVWVRDLRLRLTLLVCGAAIAAAVLAYVRLQREATIFTVTWFTNDPGWLAAAVKDAAWTGLGRWSKRVLVLLAAVAAIGLILRLALRGPPGAAAGPPARSLGFGFAVVALTIYAGTAAAGLAVSLLLTPSFSGRNLLVASPCLWCACAWLYDEAVRGAPRRLGLAAAAVAAVGSALNLTALDGRLLNRKEDWRGSALDASARPACRGRDLPVVLPALFAPDTPFYRRLSVEAFYGRYHRGGGRLIPVTRAELAASRDPPLGGLLSARARGEDPCPILAWAVHDLPPAEADALAQALAQRPDVGRPVRVRSFAAYSMEEGRWRPRPSGAYLFELEPKAGEGRVAGAAR